MKALLNFLPSENRNEVKKHLMSLVIFRFTNFLVVLLIIFGAALFGIKFLFNQEISRIQIEQKTVEAQSKDAENIDVEDAIKSLNKRTGRLEAIQDSSIYWSLTFNRLFSIIPQGITIINIDINGLEKTGTLSGKASTREAYYQLGNQLQSSSYIANAEVPISLLKTDIQFSISITFTKDFFLYET